MRCIAFGQAAAILLAALSAPGGAAPAPAAAPQVWQVDWEQEHCTIATGDPASLYLALWMTPGDPEVRANFVLEPIMPTSMIH